MVWYPNIFWVVGDGGLSNSIFLKKILFHFAKYLRDTTVNFLNWFLIMKLNIPDHENVNFIQFRPNLWKFIISQNNLCSEI